MLHFELLHSKQSMLNYDQSKTKNDTEIEKCDSHAWAKGRWKKELELLADRVQLL